MKFYFAALWPYSVLPYDPCPLGLPETLTAAFLAGPCAALSLPRMGYPEPWVDPKRKSLAKEKLLLR